jgi:hypothetical protein
MMRAALIALGVLWSATGIVIFAAPEAFYRNTPGLSSMGPFNVHFVRDVGLAFLASGASTVYGALRRVAPIIFAGVAWPVLHALFHVQIWAHRGLPFDAIFAFDLLALIAPACLGLFLASRVSAQARSARR